MPRSIVNWQLSGALIISKLLKIPRYLKEQKAAPKERETNFKGRPQ